MSQRVLIVDDHEVLRIGLGQLLRTCGFSLAGSVGDVESAKQVISSENVDVVVLDVRLSRDDGLSALEALRESSPEIPVVVLSAYDNPTYVARAVALGAANYVLKQGESKSLVEAIRKAAAGDSNPTVGLLSKIRRLMWEELDTSVMPHGFPFTSREAQVLRHISLGLSNKEIARSLSISVETVKEHVQNILRKFKATDRTDAAVRAIKMGFVD